MTKLFKCPKCGEFLHSLSTIQNVDMHCDLNLDSDENLYRNNEYTDPRGEMKYFCTWCNHTEDSHHNFVVEMDCDCEHYETSTEHTSDGYRIDICQHCGLVTQVEYIGDEY